MLEASGPDPWVGDPPDTVVSHLSAAAVHGLGEVIPHRHEFTSPRRRQTVHDDVRFHRATLTPSEHTASQGLAVTTELLQECFHLEGAPPELAAAQGLLRLVQPAGDAARRVHVT